MASLPPNPNDHPGRAPPPHVDDHRSGSGFSRSGFAPIPHRHSELPLPPSDRYDRGPPPGRYERDEYDRRERELPRRDLDPEPEFDRWDRRDDWDRRRPYRDDYDDRIKRPRSPSPLGAASRRRFASPTPPRYPPPPSNDLPDPASIPDLLNFRQFADWFRLSHPQTAKADEEELRKVKDAIENGTADEKMTKERVGMGKRYERYRREFASRQLYALYLSHQASPWFQERYSHLSAFVAQRRRLNREGRVPTVQAYITALRAGEYDNVSYDLSDEKRPALDRRQSEGDDPEGLDRALGDAPVVDDPLRVEVPASANQVFVKTVPPTAKRDALEAMFQKIDGFQYLALAEPIAKKSFHRVAWAQFATEVDVQDVVQKLDGTIIDNFTFHLGVNSTPNVGKVRVTPELGSSLSRLQKDGQRAKGLAIRLEEELMSDDEDVKPEGSVKTEGGDGVKPEKKVPGLSERGSDIVQETIDRLLDAQGLIGEDLSDEGKLRRAKITIDHWISYLRNGMSTCYYCVAPTSFPEELHRKCISHMRPHPSSITVQPELEAVPEVDESDIRESEDKVKDEDEGDGDKRDGGDERELKRSTGSGSTRKVAFPQKSAEDKWEDGLDTKLRSVLGEGDVADFGGRNIDEETKRLCAPLIKQEEASKYRCKECNKLFKAPEFVMKHVSGKHGDVVGLQGKLDDLTTFNNYVLDPQHIQPTKDTPAAVNDRILPPPSIPTLPIFNPAFATDLKQPHHLGHNSSTNGNANGNSQMMMQQQMMMMMQMQQAMMMAANGGGGGGAGTGPGGELAARMGAQIPDPLPLPLPPAPGAEDPRARRGRVSYKDLDEVGGGGEGGLPY